VWDSNHEWIAASVADIKLVSILVLFVARHTDLGGVPAVLSQATADCPNHAGNRAFVCDGSDLMLPWEAEHVMVAARQQENLCCEHTSLSTEATAVSTLKDKANARQRPKKSFGGF
jgi:hypothetical protein